MSTLQTFIQQALLKTITVPFSVLAFIFSPVFVLLKGIWLLVTGILYAPIALALKFEVCGPLSNTTLRIAMRIWMSIAASIATHITQLEDRI
jgi:hypothetical protein